MEKTKNYKNKITRGIEEAKQCNRFFMLNRRVQVERQIKELKLNEEQLSFVQKYPSGWSTQNN